MKENKAMTTEQLQAVNDSDALCEGCGADPRQAETLEGWFVNSVLTSDGRVAQVRCPECW